LEKSGLRPFFQTVAAFASAKGVAFADYLAATFSLGACAF